MRNAGHLVLRLVDIPLAHGTAIDVLLSYDSERDAQTVGEALVRYMTSRSSGRMMTLEFVREGQGTLYRMILDVRTETENLRVVVHAVNPEYVERLRTSLETFSYYMVMLGYETDSEPVILDADGGRILKSDVLIDGGRIVGKPGDGVDWVAVLQGEDADE